MKKLLAVLTFTALGFTVPATASEADYALRGVEKAASAQIEASSTTPVPGTQFAAARKVRVVLASPYVN